MKTYMILSGEGSAGGTWNKMPGNGDSRDNWRLCSILNRERACGDRFAFAFELLHRVEDGWAAVNVETGMDRIISADAVEDAAEYD